MVKREDAGTNGHVDVVRGRGAAGFGAPAFSGRRAGEDPDQELSRDDDYMETREREKTCHEPKGLVDCGSCLAHSP